jgi:hypothetical protein
MPHAVYIVIARFMNGMYAIHTIYLVSTSKTKITVCNPRRYSQRKKTVKSV